MFRARGVKGDANDHRRARCAQGTNAISQIANVCRGQIQISRVETRPIDRTEVTWKQVNSDVSRKYVLGGREEKRGGGRGNGGGARVMRPERDKGRENRLETRRREKVKRTVSRNVTWQK